MASFTNYCTGSFQRWSGKEVLSPAPPPLRTGRAPFNASGSSIEQRLCEIRPGSAPPAHDTPYETRSPHWPWGQPGRYCDRAGYRRSAEAAPARRCRPRQICFAPRAGWLSVHVRRHPREVSSLSRGVMSQPLSDPLQAGLRFLPRPLPAAPSAHLAARLPSREDDGLTTLHRRNPAWVRPRLYAGGTSSAPGEFGAPGPGHVPFWSKPISTFGLSFVYDAYGGSPGLAIPRAPGPRPPRCWQSRPRLALRSPPRG